MRKLCRSDSPRCLEVSAKVWIDEYIEAREANPDYRFSWRNKDCYQTIRKQLSFMTQEHCAFCDGRIGTESRETVEHFRPKSKFPALAYDWDNLFPCCDLCQSQKLEKFDEALLKPDVSDYRFENYFIPNYKTGELEPLPSALEENSQRAKITIALYGLNLPARNKARLREWERYVRDKEACIDDYNYRFFLE